MKVEAIRIRDIRSFADSGTIDLGSITVLVGKNNSGKSTVIASLAMLQRETSSLSTADVRFGATQGIVDIRISDVTERFWPFDVPPGTSAVFTQTLPATVMANLLFDTGRMLSAQPVAPTTDGGFIYPFLSKRIPEAWDRVINSASSRAILPDLRNLPARFDVLSDRHHPAHEALQELVRDVIGIPLSSTPHSHGKTIGRWVDQDHYIDLAAMGSGVAQMLGLLVALSTARGMLFLIEEPENDVHPEALRALLRAIERSAEKNQFVISTHNNLVVRFLGAVHGARIYETTQSDTDGVPTSTIAPVDESAEARRQVLNRLGYELADFDVNEGWLLFEESSAERIVRDFIIPWFIPELIGYGTVACNGTGDVNRTFEAVSKLVLFIHVDGTWARRVQVLVDGDASGTETVRKLRAGFPTWPADAFASFDAAAFEDYYPERFQNEAAKALRLEGSDKRAAKRDLLLDVVRWAHENPEEAKAEFSTSAKEVIDRLLAFEARHRNPAAVRE